MFASRKRIRNALPSTLLDAENTIFEKNILHNPMTPVVLNLNFKTIKTLYNQKLYDLVYSEKKTKALMSSNCSINLWLNPLSKLELDEEQENAANIKYNTVDNPCARCKNQGLLPAEYNNVKMQLIQKRSSDEPMTLELECQSCGNRWSKNG